VAYSYSENIFFITDLLQTLKNPEGGKQRLVLFGAAGWGEALLSEILKYTEMPVVFTDNDSTKQGMRLCKRSIVPPETLDPRSDIVAITTISAGSKVSLQLESLGFVRDVDYFEIMENRDTSFPFHVVDFYKKFVADFRGKDILHVGPGGKLGVEVVLSALGAATVTSIDYNSFGISYPDVTQAKSYYEELARRIIERYDVDVFREEILAEKEGRLSIESRKIRFFYPCSVSSLPFDDGSFDYVFHHAVFEHVSDPAKGYGELFRVLKYGGSTVGLVDPQDHRCFSSFGEYHPLKFLEHSRSEWIKISGNINFHNQVTAPEHLRFIRETGFQIDAWNALETMKIDRAMIERFDPMFQLFEPEELGILRFEMFASRPL
jgi:SAM-dependent methyltransferase